jgi:hypothetical protein
LAMLGYWASQVPLKDPVRTLFYLHHRRSPSPHPLHPKCTCLHCRSILGCNRPTRIQITRRLSPLLSAIQSWIWLLHQSQK